MYVDTLIEWLMKSVLQQGFSITLLFAAVVYFYREQQKQTSKIELAQMQMVKYLTEDRGNLIRLIEEMGDILKQNTAVLQRIERKL